MFERVDPSCLEVRRAFVISVISFVPPRQQLKPLVLCLTPHLSSITWFWPHHAMVFSYLPLPFHLLWCPTSSTSLGILPNIAKSLGHFSHISS